jgi:DnaJ family protein B protein 13
VKIPTLDGRTLLVPIDEILSPKSVKRIQNEGMPILNSSATNDDGISAKGDLYITFDI